MPYATIDVPQGYQKICGQDALDYVRYRHEDTDIVRGARQQHYVAEAKDQLGVERLFRDRQELLELFGRYTDTDIKSSGAVLRLLKLTYESSREPLRRVNFRADLGQEFVTISDENLQKVRREFLTTTSSRGATGRTKQRAGSSSRSRSSSRRKRSQTVPSLDRAGKAAEDAAIIAGTKLPFPVYYPKLIPRGGRFYDGFSSDKPRTYDLIGPSKKRYRAYRMVIEAPGIGEYIGVQGMNWKNPPILANPTSTQKAGGRTLKLYRDGTRLRMVAWQTERGTYWVTNTLLRSLTNREMLGIARSLSRVGS
jgi:hypothetical protein